MHGEHMNGMLFNPHLLDMQLPRDTKVPTTRLVCIRLFVFGSAWCKALFRHSLLVVAVQFGQRTVATRGYDHHQRRGMTINMEANNHERRCVEGV